MRKMTYSGKIAAIIVFTGLAVLLLFCMAATSVSTHAVHDTVKVYRAKITCINQIEKIVAQATPIVAKVMPVSLVQKVPDKKFKEMIVCTVVNGVKHFSNQMVEVETV
jgi:hypothetical protein